MTPGVSSTPTRYFLVGSILLLPIIAFVLGGASERWAQGVCLLLIGFCVLVKPPRFSLGSYQVILPAALIGLATITVLPGTALLAPGVRSLFEPQFAGWLANSLSFQPWITLEGIVMLAGAWLWFYWVATLRLSSRERRLCYIGLAAAIAILATICVVLFRIEAAPGFWLSPRQFGPFPSRNLTGNVIAIGGVMIVGCAMGCFRRRHWWKGGVLLAGLVPICVALILNLSRAGIGLLALGTLVIAAGFAVRRGQVKIVAVGVSVLLISATFFVFSETEVANRFTAEDGGGDSTLGFRGLVYKDALRLIAASPWFGIGLGSFESVFPLFRNYSQSTYRLIHPESDWVWVMAEFGLVGFVILIGGFAAYARKLRPSNGRSWMFDFAALTAIAVFLLHGTIDVPGHRLGSAAPAVLLAGLLIGRRGAVPSSYRRIGPLAFRLSGVALIAAGLVWIASTLGWLSVPGKVARDNARRDARERLAAGDWDAAIISATAGLKISPLDWELFSVRARALAGSGRYVEAISDFRRVRLLQPKWAALAFEEGRFWTSIAPGLALEPWQHALSVDGKQRSELFRRMLEEGTRSPTLYQEVRVWAKEDPVLRFTLLMNVPEDQFAGELEALLENDPELTQLAPEQLGELFRRGATIRGAERLIQDATERPRWRSVAWPYIAKKLREAGRWEEAFRLTKSHVKDPIVPQIQTRDSQAVLQQRWLSDRSDFAAALALIQSHKEAGDLQSAFDIAASATRTKDVPRYFYFVGGELAAQLQKWQAAAEAFAEYGLQEQRPR